MATSSVMIPHHARSTSVPSSPHPIAPQFDEHLSRLRSSLSTSTSSSVNQNIIALRDLYSCFEELLLLPHSQHALAKDRSAKWVDNMLDRSLRLLDVCSSSRDVLSNSRGCVQEIQSALRRRCGSELSITEEAAQYLRNRREMKKVILRSQKDLKNLMNVSSSDLHDCSAIVSALIEVEEVTCSVFESLLQSVGGARKSSWSFISKIKNQHAASYANVSEFEETEAAVQSLVRQKKEIEGQELGIKMMQLESHIQNLDDNLECLFRCMVRNRATILNILNL